MRLLPALALSGSLALGACQNPDGTTDWGSTAALGIGAAAIAGLVAVAASSGNDDSYRHPPRHRGRGYDRYDRYASWDRPAYRNRW